MKLYQLIAKGPCANFNDQSRFYSQRVFRTKEEAANAYIEDEKLFQQYLTETCSKVTEEFPPITYDYTKYKDPREYMELMREIDAKRLAKQKQLLLELFLWRKEEIEGLVHCDRSYTDAGDYYIESFELKG